MPTSVDARRPGLGGPAAAFAVTAAILGIARIKAPFAILLADRLVPGLGWGEIAVLSAYAAYVAAQFIGKRDSSRARRVIWLVFSSVFFSQFLLGVAGIEQLLMTGRLHVPVPAVVIAGPIYRGGRYFMPILFTSTLVLVGPAWCSYLCYIGSWDALAASRRRRASTVASSCLSPRVNLRR